MTTTSVKNPCLVTEDEGEVRIIRLNRPNQLNALNTELTAKLLEAMRDADCDASVRAIVLAGNGRAFCAGADVKEFDQLTPSDATAVTSRADLTMRTQMVARTLSKPVIAAVHGAALGGGAGLALGADMIVAGSNVSFGYPEIRHSIVPALVMKGLRDHVGPKLAFEMVSTGRLLDGAAMFSLGLASRVVPVEHVFTAAMDVAEKWARANEEAMKATKALFYAVGDLPYADAMLEGRRVNEKMREFRGALS